MYSTISIRTAPTPGTGALSFFEANRDIPFEIKRVYYTYDVPQNTRRGAHAHKELKQLLFCPYGSIKILLDDGEEKTEVMLDNPAKALIINPLIWHDMVWCEKDSVLCVAASDYYNEEDYLRDYAAFKEYLMNHTARTEQNRTEQNRTEQNRTEQNRTEQNRTEDIKYLHFQITFSVRLLRATKPFHFQSNVSITSTVSKKILRAVHTRTKI